MADDVTLPGTGSVIAAELVGGHDIQLFKLVDGTPGSEARIKGNADGELLISLNDLAVFIAAALKNVLDPLAVDPVTGRVRVTVDAIAGSLTLGTITTVGTVTTCATVTNQAQIGAIKADSTVYDTMENNWADCVRGRIS